MSQKILREKEHGQKNQNDHSTDLCSSFFFISQAAYSEEHKIGIGIQSAPFPVFAPSVIFNPSKNIGLQLFGRMGITSVDFLAFRSICRFKKGENYNIYVAGLLGIFRDDSVNKTLLSPDETDTTWGFGLGGGLEYIFGRLPKIGLNLELDYIRINFEKKWWQYNYKAWQLLMIGVGIHYYFKLSSS